jgi:hypothetical protein
MNNNPHIGPKLTTPAAMPPLSHTPSRPYAQLSTEANVTNIPAHISVFTM